MASPQRSADQVQTRTVPAKCTSAGGVAGRQTSLSSHTTKDRGRGMLSRLSDAEEATRKDLTKADCRVRERFSSAATRENQVRARTGPVASPCVLTRADNQSGRTPDGGEAGQQESARQWEHHKSHSAK